MLPVDAKTEQNPGRHISSKLLLLTWQGLCNVSHVPTRLLWSIYVLCFWMLILLFLFTWVITWPSYARHVTISGPVCTSRFGKRNRYVQTLRQNVPLWWKQNTSFLYFAIAIFLKCRSYFTICLKVSSGMFLSVSTVGLLIVL